MREAIIADRTSAPLDTIARVVAYAYGVDYESLHREASKAEDLRELARNAL